MPRPVRLRADALTDDAVDVLAARLARQQPAKVLFNVIGGEPFVREQRPYAVRLAEAFLHVGWRYNALGTLQTRAHRATTILTGGPDPAADIVNGWLNDLGIASVRTIDGGPPGIQVLIGRPDVWRWRLQRLPEQWSQLRYPPHDAGPDSSSAAAAAASGAATQPTSDPVARARLLDRIGDIGDINDFSRPRPLVTLEEYFEGNAESSIGYNPPDGGPGAPAFYALCRELRDRDDLPAGHHAVCLFYD